MFYFVYFLSIAIFYELIQISMDLDAEKEKPNKQDIAE